MADPQTQTTPLQQPPAATGGTPLPAVDPAALRGTVEASLQRAMQSFGQYRFDLVRAAAEAGKFQPQSAIVRAHVTEITKRLEGVLSELEKTSAVPATELHQRQWKAVSYFALLNAFAPNEAKAFTDTVGRHAQALVLSVDQSIAQPTVEQLDAAFRQARILLEYAPAPHNIGASGLITKVYEKTLQLPSEQIHSYIDATEQSTKAYLSNRSEIYRQDLRETLQLAKRSPEKVDDQWRLLAPNIREQNGGVVYQNGNSRVWNVELLGRSNGRLAELNQVAFRSIDNQDTFLTFDSAALTRALRENTLNAQLEKATHDAADRTATERHPERAALAIDLQRTLMLSVHPASNDDVITNGGFGSLLLARSLSAAAANSLIVSDSPLAEITKTIDAHLKVLPKLSDVVIDLNQHGSPMGLQFSQPITGSTLRELAQRYPQLRLHVSSIACHGGGLHQQVLREIAGHPEIRDRLSLFTQTKIESKNVLSFAIPNAEPTEQLKNRAPLQQLLLIKALFADPTDLGKAFRRADSQSRAILPLDAEAIIRGVPLSFSTPRTIPWRSAKGAA